MSRSASRPFWVLERPDAGGTKTLTTRLSREERALPVFSFEDEARMFLDFGVARDGWQVSEKTAEELLSMLRGPYSGVRTVLLDPLPGLDNRTAAYLVGVPRETFVNHQSSRTRRPEALRKGPVRAKISRKRALVRM